MLYCQWADKPFTTLSDWVIQLPNHCVLYACHCHRLHFRQCSSFVRYSISQILSRLGHEARPRSNPSPLPSYLRPAIRHRRTNSLPFPLMSRSHPTASGSSSYNFQLIINNALKAYEKRTKKDLVAHPLASQLQACNSSGDVLAILQQQVQGLDQSQSRDERWTKWLDPTVNVLSAFSETLGSGVGLVCPAHPPSEICRLISIRQVFSPACVIFAGIGVLLSVCIFINLTCAFVTHTTLRRRKMFGQAKTLLWMSSSALKCSFSVSRCTQTCLRPRK